MMINKDSFKTILQSLLAFHISFYLQSKKNLPKIVESTGDEYLFSLKILNRPLNRLVLWWVTTVLVISFYRYQF